MVDFVYLCTQDCPHGLWRGGDIVAWAPDDDASMLTNHSTGAFFDATLIPDFWEDLLAGRLSLVWMSDRATTMSRREIARPLQFRRDVQWGPQLVTERSA